MENVEGLLLGEAWSYVQKIYKGFIDAGYRLNHWLLKGEKMGVPQTRHRVFFIAIREDLNIDPSCLDMYFNYKPITYGEIRSGEGKPLSPETQAYKYIKLATPKDKRIIDVLIRLEKKKDVLVIKSHGMKMFYKHFRQNLIILVEILLKQLVILT